MDVSVKIEGPDAADQVRSLYAFLAAEDELRGCVRVAGALPKRGTLGPGTDYLAIAVGPGGISAALVTGLVTWLRQRTGDVVIKARGSGGRTVELSAKRVHGLDSAQLPELAQQLAADLADPATETSEQTATPRG